MFKKYIALTIFIAMASGSTVWASAERGKFVRSDSDVSPSTPSDTSSGSVFPVSEASSESVERLIVTDKKLKITDGYRPKAVNAWDQSFNCGKQYFNAPQRFDRESKKVQSLFEKYNAQKVEAAKNGDVLPHRVHALNGLSAESFAPGLRPASIADLNRMADRYSAIYDNSFAPIEYNRNALKRLALQRDDRNEALAVRAIFATMIVATQAAFFRFAMRICR